MMELQLINPRSTCVLVIDPQERLMKAVEAPETVIKNSVLLLEAAKVFKVPVIATTQYKKGLGPIVPEILDLLDGSLIVDKMEFNCFENKGFMEAFSGLSAAINTVVLVGVEAHICVFQSALAAKLSGLNVWVAADGVSSRVKNNVDMALNLLNQAEVPCAPTEMIVYQFLKRAGTAEFKALLQHLK